MDLHPRLAHTSCQFGDIPAGLFAPARDGWQPWSTPTVSSGVGPVTFGPISSVSWGPHRIDVIFSQTSGSGKTVAHDWYNEVAPTGWFGTEGL